MVRKPRVNGHKREKATFYLLLCALFVVLLGCTNVSDEDVQSQEREPVLATSMPSVYVTATQSVEEPAPFSFSLEEVSCQFEPNSEQDFDHWADELTPGVSTIDDLLTLTDIPDEAQPERTGIWTYTSDAVYLVFRDGILEDKSDPRTKLGDIVQHYGLPQKIVWEIPRKRSDGASYVTNLVYPEHKAVFYDWGKVTWFTSNTEFRHSLFSTQEGFNGILSTFTDDAYTRYEESAWPCGE
jgi:hypothetical protein